LPPNFLVFARSPSRGFPWHILRRRWCLWTPLSATVSYHLTVARLSLPANCDTMLKAELSDIRNKPIPHWHVLTTLNATYLQFGRGWLFWSPFRLWWKVWST